MADCSCEWCRHERDGDCPYVYDSSDCFVETIKAAKAVVDDEFEIFLSKLEEKNKALDDVRIEVLIERMRSIVYDSKQPLPEWAMREEEG